MNNIHDVLIALRRLIRAADIHSKRLVKTAGLTAPQLLLMQSIRSSGDATVGELAKLINLSQATVTTVIDRMENRELVFRQRSEVDKRKVYVYLTPKGETLLDNAPTPLQQQFVTQYLQLESWEQNMILSSLQRVAKMMDAEGIDASPVLDVGALDRRDEPLILATQAGKANQKTSA
jgi:DNA-binding MarR family transcriptional regulator